MADINRGLDLSNIGTATEAEARAFREFYDRMLGRGHPGLEFYLQNLPDAMKRYRAFADSATPRNLDTDRRVMGFGFIAFYALTGYVEGVRYLVHIQQQLGLSRSQVLEGLAIVFLHAGPRGSETIAMALADFPWIEPTTRPQFPDGWAADPEAFRSGLDFSSKELTDEELRMLERWYERVLGEVPGYVRLAGRHAPTLLKAYRHRFETCVRELPKQVVPATLLHYNVTRAHGPGIRENLLLARGFGMTRDVTMRILLSPLINAGMETLTIVEEVAGPILDSWPEPGVPDPREASTGLTLSYCVLSRGSRDTWSYDSDMATPPARGGSPPLVGGVGEGYFQAAPSLFPSLTRWVLRRAST